MAWTLGIDFGTSGARAIARDGAGAVVAQARQAYRLAAGETWADGWRRSLEQLLDEIPAAVRSQLRAIAIDGTSATVLLCDGAGKPVTPPVLYNQGNPQALENLQGYLAQVNPATQVKPQAPPAVNSPALSATASLVKLWAWKTQPEFARAWGRSRYLLHQADWLAGCLHGQWGVSDYHNSLKLGYDVHTLAYPAWLQTLGITPWLPRVVAPGTAIAPVLPSLAQRWGLQDCWVCAGTTDSIAAFLASGATRPGEAVTSLGSTLVVKLLSQTPVEDRHHGIYSHRLDLPGHAGPLWLVGGASNTGGAVLAEFFSPQQLEAYSRQIDPHQPCTLDYYPLLVPGERFPLNDPNLPPRLQPRPNNPVTFLHGLLASMARIEAQAYTLLAQQGADRLQRLSTAGGGAQNPVWTELRSQVLGVPVLLADHTEAAYGAAVLASWGLRAVAG